MSGPTPSQAALIHHHPSGRRIAVAAPAKVNLALEIMSKRPDGFHDLETVFQTIELADRVEIEHRFAASGIALDCSDATVPAGRGNLAWRAAEAFMAEGWDPTDGLHITLTKHIPHGAGLGGGSSDAAAVIRALAALFPQRHKPAALAEIARQLGSDVPFFMMGGTAIGTGRGECLSPLPDMAATTLTILMPSVSLSTPMVFAELTSEERGPRTAHGYAWWHARLHAAVSADELRALMYNRLAEPACRICPEVKSLLQWLSHQAAPFMMTGSGAACFVLGDVVAPPGIRAWKTTLRPRYRLNALEDVG